MRRVFKKGIALALAAAMVITAAPAPQAGAAKKVKLNITKKTVKTGAVVKLKVKNGNKKAKVSWKASKKNMVKLSKKSNKGVTVTVLKKTGKVNVVGTYKVGKKKAVKLTCKLTISDDGAGTATDAPVITDVPVVNNPPVVTTTQPPVVSQDPGTVTEDPNKPTDAPKVTKTPSPTPTPSDAPRNKDSLTARNVAEGTNISADGVKKSSEWMDATEDIEINLLKNKMSVRTAEGKTFDIENSTATAKLMWDGNALYALVETSFEMTEAKVYVKVGDDAMTSATGAISTTKQMAEVKVPCTLTKDSKVKAEIQVKSDNASINYYDSVSEIKLDEESGEWKFVDKGIQVDKDDSLLGNVTLVEAIQRPKEAYYTSKGSEIREKADIDNAPWEPMATAPAAEGGDEAATVAEGDDSIPQKAKKVKFVDSSYWTDVYKENGSSADKGADSIAFSIVNPDAYNPWNDGSHHDKISLAAPYDADGNRLNDIDFSDSESTALIKEWISDRSEHAQGYVIWDEDYLYVLFDINDTDITPGAANPVNGDDGNYMTDSVEFFFDEDNNKRAGYTGYGTSSAAQFRVGAVDDRFTSNDTLTGRYDLVAHAVGYKYADGVIKDKIEDGCLGYQVEYIIKLTNKHNTGDIMGMDLQVNDCFSTPEGSHPSGRACSIVAYDNANSNWESTANYGRVMLVGKEGGEQGGETTPPEVTPDPADAERLFAYQIADDTAMTIDGKADEAVWNNIDFIPFASKVYQDRKTNPTITDAKAKILWNSNGLYVYVNVVDDNISSGHNDEHKKDGIDFFLDENNSKEVADDISQWNSYGWPNNLDAFQYRFTGLNPEVTEPSIAAINKFAGGSDDAKNAYKNIEIKYVMTDDGYSIEYMIPFQHEDTGLNSVIGFDMVVQDCAKIDDADDRDAEIYLFETDKAKDYWNLHVPFRELKLVAMPHQLLIH